MTQNVNILCQTLEREVRSFFNVEAQALADALHQQEVLRHEIQALEDRCVATEQEAAVQAAKHAEIEQALNHKIKQVQDRVRQLEEAAAEDGRTIVVLRDTERTLRAELDHSNSRLRAATDQIEQLNRTVREVEERERSTRVELDRAVNHARSIELEADRLERMLADARNKEANWQTQIEKANERARRVEEDLQTAEQAAREAQETAAQWQQEAEQHAHQLMQVEDRWQNSEERLRHLLDDVGQEVGRIRTEIERQRREIEITPRSFSPGRGQSPSASARGLVYSPRAGAVGGAGVTSPLANRSSLPSSGQGREVNVSVRTAGLNDVSVRLDSLAQRLSTVRGGGNGTY